MDDVNFIDFLALMIKNLSICHFYLIDKQADALQRECMEMLEDWQRSKEGEFTSVVCLKLCLREQVISLLVDCQQLTIIKCNGIGSSYTLFSHHISKTASFFNNLDDFVDVVSLYWLNDWKKRTLGFLKILEDAPTIKVLTTFNLLFSRLNFLRDGQMNSAFEYYIKIIGELPYVIDRISLLEVSELYLLSNIVQQFKVICEFEEEGLLPEQKYDLVDYLGRSYFHIGDFFQGVDKKGVVYGFFAKGR